MPSDADATRDLLTVETPESVAFAHELAGLGSRGLALILDTALIGAVAVGEAAVFALVGWAVYAWRPAAGPLAAPWLAGGWLVAAFATYWGYFVVAELTRNGRTWGKRLMGIRVMRDDGSRLTLGDSVTRNLLRAIDSLPGSYAIGMFCVLFSARNKRLGDMAAGTVVVRDAGGDDLAFAAGDAPEVALARDFLRRRATLTEAARMQVAVEVLAALGEEPEPGWSEPEVAGRIADLIGARE